MNEMIPVERIENRIYLIRGQKVMIDRDLAELYGVETRQLKQAVRRNRDRFPDDFMFELDEFEFEKWRSQFVMSNSDKMGLRHKSYAFTEHGILMLSSVLKNKTAIEINIRIMRIFVKFRNMLSTHKELTEKFNELERKVINHESDIKGVFEIIRKLMIPPEKPKRKIGFI